MTALLIALSSLGLGTAAALLWRGGARLHQERLLVAAEAEYAALGRSGMWDDESAGWG